MDLGRVLSPEEVEAIRETITPLEKIRTKKTNKLMCISAEYCGKKVRRNESVNESI